MTDPISAAVAGTVNALTSSIIQKVADGEDPYEQWSEAIVELAVGAQATHEYYTESVDHLQRDDLKSELEVIGKQAQKLAVLGKQQLSPQNEVESVRQLANACGTYATAPNYASGAGETQLREDLNPAVAKIFEQI